MTNRFGALERALRHGRPEPSAKYLASVVGRIASSGGVEERGAETDAMRQFPLAAIGLASPGRDDSE